MPKVICKLPNASELIDGVRFVSHKDGMVSEEISDERADRFASIKGYEIIVRETKAEKAAREAAEKAATKQAEKDAADQAAREAEAKQAEKDAANKKPAEGAAPAGGAEGSK